MRPDTKDDVIYSGVLTGETAAMYRKIFGAFIGLAMMDMAGSANATLSDNGTTT